MSVFKHTSETDAIIRDGYAANRRVADIANEMGVSRSVVIGRAFRLGLSDPDRHRIAMRNLQTDPVFAARHRIAMRKLHADPAFAAKRGRLPKGLPRHLASEYRALRTSLGKEAALEAMGICA